MTKHQKWVEIDRLRAEADRLERQLHPTDIMLTGLWRFMDRHIGSFCWGMVVGMIVAFVRLKL